MVAPSSIDIASATGGETYTLLYSDVAIDQTITFDVNNWDEGLFVDTSYQDRLVADTSDGGTWTVAIPLEALTDESKGINFTWEGQGVSLDYSTNNTTWTAVGNRRTVLEDVDTTGKMLVIRVTLDDDESYLEQLKLDLLEDRTMYSFGGLRPLIFKGAAMDHTREHQSEFVEDSGAYIVNGYIEVQPDLSDDAVDVSTIELWARINDTDGQFISTASNSVTVAGGTYTFTGITAYRNGELVTNGSFPRDEWAHWVFVLNNAINGGIRIGDSLAGGNSLNMSVGHIALYEQDMDASAVQRLYDLNMDTPAIEIIDDSEIVVSEDDPAVDIYAYNWSIVSA